MIFLSPCHTNNKLSYKPQVEGNIPTNPDYNPTLNPNLNQN